MTKAQLKRKIALLESINDHLQTEVSYMDELMKMVGFQHGLETVKAAAGEIIRQKLTEANDI
ncbi:hypothetical protein [Criblamydia sequanensis]|uniref:Uncharacterized protein n=1 Tax=Candidatus Criblamydia sequanensis CRIB-18 TaxID=1437425 RepID=A0A090CXT6_9BACT|nr:hypothetical protein [Criblamydia sequanensis]CDR33022.1 conserved hypothetical protein [Criblamydia sequanensis CRIB-18]